MGKSLARLGDAPSIQATQREALVSFLRGVDSMVDRLVSTFTADIAAVPQEAMAPAQRILDRAGVVRANIVDELARLNDSAQGGDAWWRERVENGRHIVASTEDLSADMIGFLETGEVPSEKRKRNQVLVFTGVVAAIAGVLWWRTKQKEQGLSSVEDCGCSLGDR